MCGIQIRQHERKLVSTDCSGDIFWWWHSNQHLNDKIRRQLEDGLGEDRGSSECKGPDAVKSWVCSKKRAKKKGMDDGAGVRVWAWRSGRE